jgi:lincosamide nucleotidyltransferase A/C/D/E
MTSSEAVMGAGVSAGEVLRVLAALDAGGQQAWVAGGWGVDALVGRQTRVHRDLDVAVDVTDRSVDHALVVLRAIGYEIETDWRPARVELAAQGERWVDLHPVTFDEQGTGWQANVDDLPPFRYPPEAFARGLVGGVGVVCLAVEQQLLFHTGYQPRPQDLADLELLQQLQNNA